MSGTANCATRLRRARSPGGRRSLHRGVRRGRAARALHADRAGRRRLDELSTSDLRQARVHDRFRPRRSFRGRGSRRRASLDVNVVRDVARCRPRGRLARSGEDGTATGGLVARWVRSRVNQIPSTTTPSGESGRRPTSRSRRTNSGSSRPTRRRWPGGDSSSYADARRSTTACRTRRYASGRTNATPISTSEAASKSDASAFTSGVIPNFTCV